MRTKDYQRASKGQRALKKGKACKPGCLIMAGLIMMVVLFDVWLGNCQLSYANNQLPLGATSNATTIGATNSSSGGAAIGADGDITSGNVAILLKERAEIAGERIFLGEIALFQGADEALTGELGRIIMGRSPQPGYTVTITSQSILYQIQNQLDRALQHGDQALQHGDQVMLPPSRLRSYSHYLDPANISFSGPDRCLVARQCREITADEVERVFREQFFEQFSEKEFELEKVKVYLPQKLTIPDEEIEYDVPFLEHPSQLEERFIFKINHNGEMIKQIWISARLRYHTMVTVATRDLERGKTISVDDVTQKTALLNRSDPDQIDDPAQIVGMVCRQPIRAGRTLTLKMVERPLLVKRGAIIKMTVESKNLRIVGLGRAKSDGCQGETIAAENLNSATRSGSQGNVYGVVIGENQIRITF